MAHTVDLDRFNKADLTPKLGSWVTPDGWQLGGGTLVESDWNKADFRLTTSHEGLELAVKVEVSGRKVHFTSTGSRVRVKVTFLGDCEPDTETHGWMALNS